MAFATLAEQWLAVKRLEHPDRNGHSHHARVDDLIRFTAAYRGREAVRGGTLATVADGFTLADVDEDGAYRAFAELIAQGCSPATVARTLSTMRNFTRWAARRGYVAVDALAEVRIGAVRAVGDADDDREPSPVRAFTPDDVRLLCDAAADPPETLRGAWAARDVAILTVLATCGPRVSELCALRLRHVVRGGSVAQLHLVDGTKRGKRRQVPVPDRTLTTIDTWLTERAARLTDPALTDPLFVRNDGRVLNRFYVDRLVRRCAAHAGVVVPDGAAAHALRHHFGVQLGLRGVPGPVVQQLFGHTDPRTTAGYQRADPAFLVAPLRDAGWL